MPASQQLLPQDAGTLQCCKHVFVRFIFITTKRRSGAAWFVDVWIQLYIIKGALIGRSESSKKLSAKSM